MCEVEGHPANCDCGSGDEALLSTYLTPQDVRQIHLDIFYDLGTDYLRHGPFGSLTRADVLRKILNVRGKDIRRTIDSVNNFSLGTIAEGWSWYMALACGLHSWPDANHRTGLISFNVATARGLDCFVSLPDEVALEMVLSSKEVRNAEFERRSHYYSPDELSSPTHPYRRVFARFESQLLVQAI